MKVTIIPIAIGAFDTKDYKSDWSTWKLENEWIPSKLQHC